MEPGAAEPGAAEKGAAGGRRLVELLSVDGRRHSHCAMMRRVRAAPKKKTPEERKAARRKKWEKQT